MEQKSNQSNDIFYCYSKKLRFFIQSFGVDYIDRNVNKNTNVTYWTFKKSDALDKIILLYNKVKHTITV